jgi:Short C-terminal domain
LRIRPRWRTIDAAKSMSKPFTEPDSADAQADARSPVGQGHQAGVGADAADKAAAAVTDPMAGPDGTASDQPVKISRTRLVLVDVLIGVTTLLLVVAIFAVWSNRLLFSPDNWSTTSSQLLSSPNIRSGVANYAVDQLYANVNVAGVIKSGLPSRLEPLAGPAAGALRSGAVKGVELALTRPLIQDAWEKANRAANQTFIAIVEGGKGPVRIKQGAVTLNLSQIVDDVASRLGLPANLSSKLPPNIANLTVFKSNQLKFVQNVGNGIKGLALWLTIGVPLLYALAIVLARNHHRRTLMTVGFAAAFGGLLVIVARQILVTQIVGSLTKDASLRPAITDAVSISTQMLHEIAAGVIYIGIPLTVAAWFAGPARPAGAVRRAMAPFLREHLVGSYVITLAVMALVFIWNPIHATGTPAGIIVFTVLALLGTFILRRQTDREFPDARRGEATARVRARLETMREQRRQSKGRATPVQATIPEQLRQLADLREHGTITADEYKAAKARLLTPGA